MPLIKSKSKRAMNENISRLMHEGYPQKQAVAIGYSIKRKAEHKGGSSMKKHHIHHMKEAHKHMKEAHHSHKKAMHHMEKAKEMKMEPKETHIGKLAHGAGHSKLHTSRLGKKK